MLRILLRRCTTVDEWGVFGPTAAPSRASFDELTFRSWYQRQAAKWGLDPNPDDPRHHYDYRAAFKANKGPDPKTGHWPSEFKADDHPNRYVGILDTKTGKPAPSFKGGLPGLGKVSTPSTSAGAIAKEAVKTAGTAWMRNLMTAPVLAEDVLSAPAIGVRALVEKAGGKLPPRPVGRSALEQAAEPFVELDARQRDRLAAAAQEHPVIGTAAYAAAELGAGLLDPTNIPLGSAASRVPRAALAEEAMAARVAGKTPGVLQALAESAELRPEMGSIKLPGGERRLDPGLRQEVTDAMERLRGLSDDELLSVGSTTTNRAEEIAAERLAFERRAGTHYGPPKVPEVLEPEFRGGAMTPEMAAPPGYTVRRTGAGIEVMSPSGVSQNFRSDADAAAWLDRENDRLLAQSDADERLRASWESDPDHWRGLPETANDSRAEELRTRARLGEEPDDLPVLTEDEYDRLADTYWDRRGAPSASAPPPGAGGTGGGGEIGGPGGAQPPISARPEMSTKGITNVAGMQPELQEAALDNFDLIYAARGKPRSVSVYHDAQALADETGLTLADFLDTPAGRLWNDREVALGRSILGGLRNRIKTTADQVAAGTLDPAAARSAIADDRFKLAKIMGSLQGQGASEWGRGLRSLQDAVGPFDTLGLAQGPTEKLGLALQKRYADVLDDDVIRRISELDADRPEDLMNFLRTMERPKFRDYVSSYWYGSILSGPKTLLRNGIGNVVKLAVDTEMRAVTPLAHKLMPGLEGRRYMREVVPAHVGLLKGLPKGIERFAYVIKNGYDPERLVRELTTGRRAEKFMPLDAFLLSQNKGVRAAGAGLNYGPRILEATDAFFKSIAESSERYAWATRKAIEEGAPDVADRAAALLIEQPDEMIEAAKLFAAKATYTDPMSAIGTWAAAGRKVIPGGQFLMPFIHVSDRVAAGITDFIPGSKPRKLLLNVTGTKTAGEAWDRLRLGERIVQGGPEAADLIARQAIGGMLAMVGIGWAMQGRLTGTMPRDADLRNDAYGVGKQAYSLLVRGAWWPIRDLLGPLAGPFVAAAQYHDHIQAGEDPTPATLGMTLSSANYMLDASYLQTLQDVMQGVQEEDLQRGATQAGARIVGGFAPWSGLQRGIATAMDTGPRGGPRVVEKEGFVDELKDGLPGLRQQLPARIGPLGEELEISTGRAGAFFPVVPTESKIADPALEERVGRLRYSLQRMRTEMGRVERKIDATDRAAAGVVGQEGRAGEMADRAAKLREELPPIASPAAAIDQVLDEVRALEDEIRRLRANDLLPPEVRREQEIELQRQMEEKMRAALEQLQQ